MEAPEQTRAELLQEAKDWLEPTLDVEVRLRIALRYSDAQLYEILMLHTALNRLRNQCFDWLGSPMEIRPAKLPAFNQAIGVATASQLACRPLLAPEVFDYVSSAISFAIGLRDEYPDGPNEDYGSRKDLTFSAFFCTMAEIMSDLRRTDLPW